jgi:hypothetical protein
MLGDAPAADERGYVAVARRPMDSLVVTTNKTADKHAVDLFRFDAGGALVGRTRIGAEGDNVLEAKVASLAGDKILAVYLVQDGWKVTLKAAVGHCADTSSAPPPATDP